MAFANLGRNKKKTVLVVLSLALSVTLFNALCAFVGGFSMEKYVSSMTCADFIVSTPDYFRFNPAGEFITPEQIEEIAANTKSSLSGTGYAVRKPVYLWMTEDALRQDYARYESAEQLDSHMSRMEHRGTPHRRYTGGVPSEKTVWSQRCRVHGLRLGRASVFHELSLWWYWI